MNHLVLLFALQFLFLSNENLLAQWVQTNVPNNFLAYAIAINGDTIFAGGDSMFVSKNKGFDWTPINNGLTTKGVYSLTLKGNEIIAGGGGIFRSSNLGANWIPLNGNGLPSPLYVFSLMVNGSNLFAGTNFGVYFSSDYFASWTHIDLCCPVYCFAFNGVNAFAGLLVDGVYFSSNYGLDWYSLNTGLTFGNVNSLVIKENNIFAGTEYGVFLSTNNGNNWAPVNNGLIDSINCSLAASGSNIFAGTRSGVYLSSNNGLNWKPISDSLPNSRIYSLACSDQYIFAGTNHKGLWRRPLSELVGVAKEVNELPKNCALSQNYPNPFNPTTTISYSLPKASNVKLTVFNTLGQEIKTLISEYKTAGNYTINFNASDLPSGIYFYQLKANDFISIKKMELIK